MSTDIITSAGRDTSIQEIKAGVQLAKRVLEEVMIKDTHYGTIPGTPKPTLYKAGAEKILSTFGIAVCPVVDDLSTDDEIRYRVRAEGRSNGVLVGTGIGECSTMEEKYKWRAAVCDEEFLETPEDRRRKKWKKGWNNAPPKSVDQIRTVPADLANTVLKMAKKRAMIDLTLTATACSDVFDQDLEDLPDEVRQEMTGAQGGTNGKPDVKQPQEQGGEDFGEVGECLSVGQQNVIGKKLEEAGVSAGDLIPHLNGKGMKVNLIADILQSEMTAVIKMITSGEVKPC